MPEERRSDDRTIAVLAQKLTDFMQAQSKANEQIITEIKELRDKTFNLPCKVHEQRINDMGRVIVGLWVIVGAVGLAVLTEWIRFLK